MPVNKHLFMDDINGVNGAVAREIALKDVEKYLDHDISPEDLEEFEELLESLEEKDEEIEGLEEENEKLKEKVKKLEAENVLLKKENFAVGNLLDDIVIKKKNPFLALS